MDFKDSVKLLGDFHHIEISPTSTIELGTDVTFRSFVSLEVANNAKLTLGNRVFFNDHCTIRCGKEIEIGKDTMFGDGVRIFDHNHKYSNYHIEKIQFTADKITIGNNCWIGTNVVILKGVTIGDNVIIGANHVFTLTASDTLENLDYLVQNLPEVSFHIAAKTNISDYLESFNRYENVNIYTNVHHDDIIEDLLKKSDIYLDINHWGEVDGIVNRAIEQNKPVYAFENTNHDSSGFSKVFRQEDADGMVTEIQKILGEK